MIKWTGKQENCDICGERLDRFEMFYDGRLQNRSTWALMCTECWMYCGAGVGTGFGQEYDSVSKVKIRG